MAFVLLVFYLGSLSLRALNVPDEGRYPSIALAMLQRNDFVSTMLNGGVFMDKPALYYWLEALSMHIFGINEWSIRLPSALSAIWGALLTRHVATRFFDHQTGWLAGLILGTSLLYYISGNYADMDLEVAVWISSALFFSLIGLHCSQGKGRRGYFFMAYLFSALAFLTKGLMGIVFPVMVLGLYSILTRQWGLIRRIYLPSGLLIFFIVSAPWYFLMQKAHPDFFHYFFVYQQFVRFTESGFNSMAPFWFYVPVVFLGLFPWSFFIPSALIKAFVSSWKESPCFYLAIWAVSIFLFFSIPGSKPVTYIMPVFPPLSILIARRVSAWLQDDTFFHKAAIWVIMVLICIAGILGFVAGIAPHYLKLTVPSSANTGIVSIAIVLIATFLIAAWFTIRHHKKALVITTFCSLALFLVLANILAGKFNPMSTKPLAVLIQNSAKPESQIISYRQYFYDLPLYLHNDKPVIVVDNWNNRKEIMAGDNWRRELYLGLQSTPDARKWLVEPERLSRLLEKPSWVFARKGSVRYLLDNYPLKLVAEHGKVALLSNVEEKQRNVPD